MKNVKLTIAYDGTAYYGWQIQLRKPTIQGKIVDAIRRVTGEKVTVYGAGRTDRGVHAAGQVANFHTESRLKVDRFPYALNAHLPDDIAVRGAEEVPEEFHAQFTPHVKTYVYTIFHHPLRPALERWFVHHIRVSLDVEAMRRAARHFVGKHDFRAVCSDATEKENTVRTIERCEIDRASESAIRIIVEGPGFLYNMVRSIAGTLVDVGRGSCHEREIPEILRSRDRHRAGPTLPPSGLMLLRIVYRRESGVQGLKSGVLFGTHDP